MPGSLYIYGAFVLVIVGLFVWARWTGLELDAANQKVKTRDAQITSLVSDLKGAEATNKGLNGQITLLQKANDTISAISNKFTEERKKSDASTRAAIREITNAPASDRGIVPLVLRRQLERMRGRQAPADSVDPNAVPSVPGS